MGKRRGTETGMPEIQNMLQPLKKKTDELKQDLDEIESEPCCACQPLELTNPMELSTTFDPMYDVAVLNEYVFVLGYDTDPDLPGGKLNVYHVDNIREFVLVGSVYFGGDSYRRMTLQGRFIYLTKTISGGGSTFAIVDVGEPNAPYVVHSGYHGTSREHVAVQGRWVYLSGSSDIKIIDISVPDTPVIVSAAS